MTDSNPSSSSSSTVPLTFAPQRTSSVRPQRIQPAANSNAPPSAAFSSARRIGFDRYSKMTEEANRPAPAANASSTGSGTGSGSVAVSGSVSTHNSDDRSRRDDSQSASARSQRPAKSRMAQSSNSNSSQFRDGGNSGSNSNSTGANWQRIERVGRFDDSRAHQTGTANSNNNNKEKESANSPPAGLSLISSDSLPSPVSDPNYSPSGVPVHPLQHRWVLWFDHRIQKKAAGTIEVDDYESNLNEVGAFASVEGFWQLFHHIQMPSQLEMGANYHLFKHGIKPTWEDASNAGGGKWAVRFTNREKPHVDYYWQNLVMAIIGGTIDEGDEICGCVFSKRKGGDRLAVWLRSKDNEAELMKIGQRTKTAIMEGISNIPISLAFDAHEVALNTGFSYYAASHKYEIK